MVAVSSLNLAWRRRLFISLYVALTLTATLLMANLLAEGGFSIVEVAILIIFVILTQQIAFGFCLGFFGYLILREGRREGGITRLTGDVRATAANGKTAVIMTICNEEVGHVFANLKAIRESVQRTGRGDLVDFFILSDTSDPNKWIAEEKCWLELCKQMDAFGRIFYRKRRVRLNRKSGNVADFCRRWGGKYECMIPLDADSLMTGETILRLTDMMAARPRAGLIQTVPKLVRGKTFYGRLQQWAHRLYAPLFTAGSSFWHMGEGNYWGHNAIVRIRPFMEYCALPPLRGKPPFGGRILSHDTIEAALIQRGGYEVWLAADLDGSYEEGPPTMTEAFKRDQRWCQGNLQHILMLGEPGLKPASRVHIFMGIMSYGACLLWLIFIVLSVVQMGFGKHLWSVTDALGLRTASLISPAKTAALLLAMAAAMLFVPKILGVRLAWLANDWPGGREKLLVSAALEFVWAFLLAPVQMWVYSKFILVSLLGESVIWGAQQRKAKPQNQWQIVLAAHGGQSFAGALGAAACWFYLPELLYWLWPILLGLMGAAPLAALTSSLEIGRNLAREGILLVPEEVNPPLEVTASSLEFEIPSAGLTEHDAEIAEVVLDPVLNTFHRSLLRPRPSVPVATKAYLRKLGRKMLVRGPQSLALPEQQALLGDNAAIHWLHEQIWEASRASVHRWWQGAMEKYILARNRPLPEKQETVVPEKVA